MALSDLLPSSLTEHPILTVLALILFPLTATLLYDFQKWYHMPPGPIPIPFIGNKHLIPRSKPWLQFEDWSRVYGPIFTIWIGRTPTVILSDPAIAVDLLEKRSTVYSSRPRMVAMGELYNDNAGILVQPYGKDWSLRRKLLHHAMTPKALRLYKPIQEAEATRLCHALLLLEDSAGQSFERLLERFTSSVVFCVAYGHRIDSLDAGVIRSRFEFMHYMASLNVPGRYLCESVPLLKHVPAALAPWKREIQAMGAREAAANLALWDLVKADLAAARHDKAPVPDSLTKLVLELREKEDIPLSEQQLSYTPASLFGAGSDTTASTLCTAVLGLVTHPDVLRRAQAELDGVLGRAEEDEGGEGGEGGGAMRLPTFADAGALPYVAALVKETLRWRPVAVLGGTPRSTTADDDYGEFTIPAGTTVLSNFWAMNLNPDYYPHPHVFDPARFLALTTSVAGAGAAELSAEDAERAEMYTPARQYPGKTGENVFGVGRRVCPGAELATNSLFIALSRLIWAFDIEAAEGVTYDTFNYTEGFNIRPVSFPCSIKIRSAKHREVLEREMKHAEAFLEKFTPFSE
ncbi:hypothetical protein MBLNU459_g5701t1 [Dothideomycetes sp. NU459]